LQPKALAGAKDFFDLFARAGELAVKESILELMEFLLARSGYKDSLLDGSEEGAARWENVEQLFNVAAKYRGQPGIEGVSGFLEEAALMTDLDSAQDDSNKLTLMTLHSAKGLEFDNVFFSGLEEGLLPHSRSMNSAEEVAEEIRLAYVGMTRAKKNLYLSFARMRQVYGELKRSIPSRILKAIPEKLVHKITNT
ncbi:MAG: ATP-dependent helicase, partial [bacterium]|nr:ATP-dependent helicase [bacterium]